MQFSMPVAFLAVAAAACAQSDAEYSPLGELRKYLQLTDAQTLAILANNDAYNGFSYEKQNRVQQILGEIDAETAKEVLDPMALGVRYVETELICREIRDQAEAYQTKNIEILTEPQKLRLQSLEAAAKLAQTIYDAHSSNLMGAGASHFAVAGVRYFLGPPLVFGDPRGCFSSSATKFFVGVPTGAQRNPQARATHVASRNPSPVR